MSHIERKKVKGRYYLYRYQSYRDADGRVRKKLIEYIGSMQDHPELFVDGRSVGTRWIRRAGRRANV